jgi:NAD(P)-dependent dehydrogenase (short-subunit alcohol dehydrogenase family)
MALRPSLDRVSMAEHRSHTSALDVDLSGDGISVTTVAVGLIDTPPGRPSDTEKALRTSDINTGSKAKRTRVRFSSDGVDRCRAEGSRNEESARRCQWRVASELRAGDWSRSHASMASKTAG